MKQLTKRIHNSRCLLETPYNNVPIENDNSNIVLAHQISAHLENSFWDLLELSYVVKKK